MIDNQYAPECQCAKVESESCMKRVKAFEQDINANELIDPKLESVDENSSKRNCDEQPRQPENSSCDQTAKRIQRQTNVKKRQIEY